MDIEVNGKSDVIEAEVETTVDVADDSQIILQGEIMINAEETATAKELERINIDIKEGDNINEKMEGANIYESIKTKAKGEDIIMTDEVIRITNKDEIRNNVGRDRNINIKQKLRAL